MHAESNNERILARGEVYYVHRTIVEANDLRGDALDNEREASLKEGRPAIIISCTKELMNKGNTIQVVFLTSSTRNAHLPTNVHVTTPTVKDSLAICNQVNTINVGRLGEFMCKLKDEDIEKVDHAVANNLDLSHPPRPTGNYANKELSALQSKYDCLTQDFHELKQAHAKCKEELLEVLSSPTNTSTPLRGKDSIVINVKEYYSLVQDSATLKAFAKMTKMLDRD